LRSPICSPNPSGRKVYMKKNTTEAPTKETAIGRKISDFTTASVLRGRRSASTATASPNPTQKIGTTMAQNTELRSETRYVHLVKRRAEVTVPTNSEPSALSWLVMDGSSVG